MPGQVVRGVARVLGGVALGAVPAAIYSALVGAVHFGAYGRWDRAPAFALGCVTVGALAGLLGGIKWALSDEAALGSGLPPGGCLSHVGAGSPGRGRSTQAPLRVVSARPSDSAGAGRWGGALGGRGCARAKVRRDGPPSHDEVLTSAGGCMGVAVRRFAGRLSASSGAQPAFGDEGPATGAGPRRRATDNTLRERSPKEGERL